MNEELNEQVEVLKEETLKEEGRETQKSKELQEFQKFIQDPSNRKNAFRIASTIQERVGKNWFSLRRVMKKTGFNRKEAEKNLYLCEMFGFLSKKIGTYQDGKENAKLLLFKITLSNDDKISSLEDKIQAFQWEIEKLQNEIASLKG